MSAGLPRKLLPFSDKEKVWQRVHNYIIAARLQDKAEISLPVWKYLFLPRTLARIGATVMVVILALTMVGSVANAQPGETLYPVKIVAEQVEKVAAVTDEAKVKVSIRHAKRRLAEVKTLVEAKKDTKIVEDTLAALKTSTEEMVEVVAVFEVRPELTNEATEVAVEQEKVLTSVGSGATSEVKEAVEHAIISTKESITKLTSEEVKGTTVSAGEENVTEATTTPKTTSSVPSFPAKSKKIIKSPVVKDTPVETDTQLGDVVTIDENNEPEAVQ
ncbi:MAG: hypothetical protein A2751_05795 [Candidatus Doudnabacteria bacterium RIFCSPHIGHO2_01_FULL_46_14]|uniref:DUF5667 domain-containing protein n=1 Tax=Candidatus Doudnabacteria bacterium RIFCSPHIGHO2_01_FULL_46_14 TaxID=1817824 RepID=A0A1F5NNM3_9BACT|nr:MAG: hypothetical protein A2751_05795 [Candidatus Doudnabacteria bacterium RIFCSPHIGHO2_01_FULL_46_14]